MYHTLEDGSVELFTERIGISSGCNVSHPLFHAECHYRWSVSYSNDLKKYGGNRGQTYEHGSHGNINRSAVIVMMEKSIKRLTGLTVSINPVITGYCYAKSATDPYFLPLKYEPESDTIRHAISNHCVVAFRDGKFSTPQLDVDSGASKYRRPVDKALSEGFHSCDRKNGDDYCKRRLAWLAGCYVVDRFSDDRCAWLTSQMELMENLTVETVPDAQA